MKSRACFKTLRPKLGGGGVQADDTTGVVTRSTELKGAEAEGCVQEGSFEHVSEFSWSFLKKV